MSSRAAGVHGIRRGRWRTMVGALFGLGTLGWSPIPAIFALTSVILLGAIPVAVYSLALSGNAGLAVFSLALLLGLAALLG